MNSTPELPPAALELDAVIATELLSQRASRSPNSRLETQAMLDLVRELAEHPREFFAKLVKTALDLSNADSTGISLLNQAQTHFIWPAVAGELRSYLGSGTPSDFGPCGTVLERDMPLLFQHPERHFTYLEPITPSLEEVLLIPFYVREKAVGTIWAVIHRSGHQFDAEDRRILTDLSTFASSAFVVLANIGELDDILARDPV